MAGGDGAFRKRGFPYHKLLTEISGKTLIEHTINPLVQLPGKRVVILLKEDAIKHHIIEVLRLIDPQMEIILAEGQTSGAACSCLLAIDHIRTDVSVLITNGDQIIKADIHKIIRIFEESRDLQY